MAQRFREFDWSQNPLGPPEYWDVSLRVAVSLMLRSSFPQFISWGPERIFLYNDAYRPILGSQKHPAALGAPFEKIWKEIWPDLFPIIQKVDSGESSYFEDLPLLMLRNGFEEQTYFTFSYSPIMNDEGNVQGLFCSCVETTSRKRTEDALRIGETQNRLMALDATEKSARLETVISTMTDGITFIDPQGQIIRMNDEALRLHGYKTSSEMPRSLCDYATDFWLEDLSGEPLAIEQWPASRVIRGERFSNFEVQVRNSKLNEVWMGSYGGAPIFDSHGKVTMGVLMVRDITLQKQAELLQKQSEERLQLIIETIPQGIWRTNPDGSADYFSERFYELVGYSSEEFLGWGWSEVIHPEDRPRALAEWQKCRELKKPVSVEFRILLKNGSYRWFLSLGNPFFDENGELIKYFGTWTDIHNQKMYRTELQTKSDALENSLNGFDIVNAKGELIYANKAYLKMWGYDSLEEIKNTSPVDHCADPNIPSKIIKSLKESGECIIEFLAKRKDGSTFDVRMWARLDYDSEGNEIYPSTSIDVTEQKNIQKALTFSKDQAERANQLKSAFLANMSHEIRTPLGAMMGFADLLRDLDLSSEERSNYIDILIRNGNSLSVIINDILDLSKVESGHLTLESVEVDPHALVKEVMALMAVKADEKQLYFEYQQDPLAPKNLITDPVRLKQVLLNLVSNAIKFTSHGHVIIRSFTQTAIDNHPLLGFEIQDTGIGIPDSQVEGVFNMFVQADGSMTRRFGGTGLGLALSRKLAQAMGGDVVLLKSEVGKGSTFVFTVKDAPAEKNEVKPDVPVVLQTPAKISETNLKGIKVLVVDDAADNRHLIGRILEKQGASIDMAVDGYEAYKKALQNSYDVVLMDIQMPRLDGYSATQKLRESGFQKPIIALTAHAMSEVGKKCLNVGCTDHLTKPIDFNLLTQTIQRYLEPRHFN